MSTSSAGVLVLNHNTNTNTSHTQKQHHKGKSTQQQTKRTKTYATTSMASARITRSFSNSTSLIGPTKTLVYFTQIYTPALNTNIMPHVWLILWLILSTLTKTLEKTSIHYKQRPKLQNFDEVRKNTRRHPTFT